jgi:uracil-DNA glycosylase
MTQDDRIKLEASWKQALRDEFEKPYMGELRDFLRQEHAAGKEIYPPGPLIFNALNSTPLNDVKVVILGQDPYHGPNQAHGLCFSVQPGVPTPPSLVNIYKELKRDLNIDIPNHGYLQSWADQGVLLLNTTLTVERANAASHAGKGWQHFTDKVIETVSAHQPHLVFLLWGACSEQEKTDRCVQAPDPDRRAPVAAVGIQGLPGLRAFWSGEQVPGTERPGAD